MAHFSTLLVSNLGKHIKQADYDGLADSFTSSKIKGDGQLKVSNGLHTIAVSLRKLVGEVFIQGTLKAEPTETDWFNIVLESPNPTNNATTQSILCTDETTSDNIYIFYGSFFWIRAKIDPYTFGSVNFIRLTF